MPELPPLFDPQGAFDWETLFQIYEFAQFAELAASLTSSEVDFIEQVLAVPDGGSLLDVACGAGRHALELGRRGYSVEGIEINEALVAYASACAYEDASRVRFAQADMRSLDVPPQFDGVLVMNSSLGFFDDATNQAVLKSCADALVHGGRLMLQCINPYRIESYMSGFRTGWYALAGGYLLREASFEPTAASLRMRYRFVAPATGLDIEHPGDQIRLYGFPELRAMLQQAGLRLLTVFGDAVLPAVPFEESSQWQVIIAERI